MTEQSTEQQYTPELQAEIANWEKWQRRSAEIQADALAKRNHERRLKGLMNMTNEEFRRTCADEWGFDPGI